MPTEQTPPSRRDLRACLFWCSRWLLGGGVFHRGAIHITIGEGDSPGDGTDLLTVRPRTGEELYDALAGPGTEHAGDLGAKAIAALVGGESLRIWQMIADRQPVPSKVIVSASGVERSRCYVLLGDMVERGLIRDDSDGYRIADAELYEAVTRHLSIAAAD